jgi:diaminopimelate epimerase
MTRTLEFTKMHGAGNDFVVLDGLSQELPALDRLARRLADRRFGVGADQILVVRPSRTADFRMDIWNADGSRAEMCANGIRAFYEYVRQRGLSDADEITPERAGSGWRWAGPCSSPPRSPRRCAARPRSSTRPWTWTARSCA